jgi:uncharacterized protein (TIGR03435 family)
MEDKTGLTGTFEFDLRFRYDPDETLTASDREDHGFLLPLLNIALARLGLDVKNMWAPVDMLHVDHADKIPAGK